MSDDDTITLTREQYEAAFPKGNWADFLKYVQGDKEPLVITDQERINDALYLIGRVVIDKTQRPFKLYVFKDQPADVDPGLFECDLALVQKGNSFDVHKDRFGIVDHVGS